MSRRIAVLVVCPCRGSIYSSGSSVPNHHRYTLFERRVKTGTSFGGKPEYTDISTALLRYEDMSIEEFMAELSISFSVSRGLQARKNAIADDEGRRYMYVSAAVSGDDRVIAHHLGECEGYECYAVYKQSDVEGRNALSSFHIKGVPAHGYSSVIYQEETLRKAFTSRNITQTIHHEGDMPTERQLVLFEWMNERIKPIVAPMIALLPPPHDCR